MNCIAFKGGYKYQLAEGYALVIEIRPDQPILAEYISLTTGGLLIVKKGYAWDGPSGPTIDSVNFMRGSLVHDALYQLIREGHLGRESHRETADRILQRICLEDGMWRPRAWWIYWGVRLGGGPSVDPTHDKPVCFAPDGCEGLGHAPV